MRQIVPSIVFSSILVAAGLNHNEQAGLRNSNSRAAGFVRALEFKHRLRVCNAYPYDGGLDVFRGKSEKLTADPVEYKGCADLQTPLKSGDKLDFKVGDANAGTFAISELPNNDAILLLVIHRHDTLSTAVSFESHMFANLLNAQIAVIDTFKGTARATASIRDQAEVKKSRVEQLRYDSVVAVNPGKYEVVLTDPEGKEQAKTDLIALNRQSYVVLRTGVQSQQGPSYPEELVVYPHSTIEELMRQESGDAFSSTQFSMKLIFALCALMLIRE